MNAETIIGLGVTALPLVAGMGAGINWYFTHQRQARLDEAKRDETEREYEDVAYDRLRSTNTDLEAQLRELTPRLSEIRKEYTAAIQQCIALLDQLRSATEENNRISHDTADQRLALMKAIGLQRDHIELLRAQMLLAGMNIPPIPDISTVVARFDPSKEQPNG